MLTKLLYGPTNSIALFLAAHGYGGDDGANLFEAYSAAAARAREASRAAWDKK